MTVVDLYIDSFSFMIQKNIKKVIGICKISYKMNVSIIEIENTFNNKTGNPFNLQGDKTNESFLGS